MNKEEFLNILKNRLLFLNANELKVQLDYYTEMIDDRIEDGMTELEAVKDLGDITDIVNTIKGSYGAKTNFENRDNVYNSSAKKTNNSNRNLIILIIAILTFPLWMFIPFTIFAVILALFSLVVGFVFGGIGMLFSTFSILDSPVASILFNIGLSFLFMAIGVLLIPVCKCACILIKNIFSEVSKFLKGDA